MAILLLSQRLPHFPLFCVSVSNGLVKDNEKQRLARASFRDGTFFYNKGIPALLYGSGRMDLGHSDNEYVDLNEVKQAVRTYAEAIARILGTEREPRQI
jgi:acetylornithine deacetylase/succinyl-diaminopimelate desuccinylase-like protein